ncbi:MAG: arylsulfatase regulator [Hahellaceae bacterium]|nr:arylsulfatase regulator [Hahellaceae bacterium]
MSAVELSAEQLQMVKIIHDHARRFPLTETGDEHLLQTCYDYMDAFKRVMDSTSRIQMDYICQRYDGFYRFAKLMEMLARGIADGIIDVPKDH